MALQVSVNTVQARWNCRICKNRFLELKVTFQIIVKHFCFTFNPDIILSPESILCPLYYCYISSGTACCGYSYLWIFDPWGHHFDPLDIISYISCPVFFFSLFLTDLSNTDLSRNKLMSASTMNVYHTTNTLIRYRVMDCIFDLYYSFTHLYFYLSFSWIIWC